MIALRGLDDEVRPYAEYAHAIASYYGVPVQVTSTYRTWEDQRALRNRYLRGESQFPANNPGDSAHNYGLAWDSYVEPAYRDWWGMVREYVGFDVPPNDWIHAEVPNWRTTVQ